MKKLRHISVIILFSLLNLALSSQAQESITIPRSEYESLKRQAEAAGQLAAELNQAKAELRKLKGLSDEPPSTAQSPSAPTTTSRVISPPTGQPTSTGAAAASASAKSTPTRATAPFAPLPAVDLASPLEVGELIQHFAQNPPAATGRYDGKKLKLQGAIAGFDKPALRQDFELVFRTPAGQLVGRVAPPERYPAVFTTNSGATLTGRTERGGEVDLLKIGDVVSFEGTCQGFKDGSIRITRCKVAGLK